MYLVDKSWRCFGSNISAVHSCCSARSTALNAISGVHRWWWVSIVSDCLGVGGDRVGVIRQEIAGIDSGLRSRGGVSVHARPILSAIPMHSINHLTFMRIRRGEKSV